MALFILETLVLRGSVLCDVLALNLRLGTSDKAGTQAPGALAVSVQHPSPSPDFGQPRRWSDVADTCVADTATGAGRSFRHPSPARTAGTTLPSTRAWWPTQGGPAPAAAMLPSRIPAGALAPASETTSRRQALRSRALPEGSYCSSGRTSSQVGLPMRGKSAGRTPPGSTTWERGER
jgi:hypothetical protein